MIGNRRTRKETPTMFTVLTIRGAQWRCFVGPRKTYLLWRV